MKVLHKSNSIDGIKIYVGCSNPELIPKIQAAIEAEPEAGTLLSTDLSSCEIFSIYVPNDDTANEQFLIELESMLAEAVKNGCILCVTSERGCPIEKAVRELVENAHGSALGSSVGGNVIVHAFEIVGTYLTIIKGYPPYSIGYL